MVRPSALAVLRLMTSSNLDRQIGWLCATQNAIHIGGGTTKVFYLVDSVGEQTAFSGEVRYPIDRWYVVSGGRRNDRRAMRDHGCIRHDDKAASRLAPKGDDGGFDFYVAMNRRNDWHDLERQPPSQMRAYKPMRRDCRD